MPFDPSGLPTLPACESDIARWASEFQAWAVSKLGTAHSEIDQIEVDPFDICTEVGNLSSPSCLVPADGIDTSAFSFAPDDDTPITPGVLPWPGSVLDLTGTRIEVRQGTVTVPVETYGTDYTVTFPSNLPDMADYYFINIEMQTCQRQFFWSIWNRSISGFTIRTVRDEYGWSGTTYTATFTYTAVSFGG
jgi:hypothetical protein